MAPPKEILTFTQQMIRVYSVMFLWIGLSATVILYNKYVLAVFGFPYPVALTLMHMGFCSALAFLIVKLGYVKAVDMSVETYIQSVVPIGALFAAVLWMGNAAYLYLSVSFIQMLKAMMPVAVFSTGVVMRTEQWSNMRALNMVVVAIGVAIASFGEINFVVVGVILQMLSVGAESIRLTLVQILLQRNGIKLNPITTLYYVAPACFLCLLVPFFALELPKIIDDDRVQIDFFIFFTNAAAAFCLNLSVFLLIGKTSALTMNIAGVIKDWMLIGLSVLIFGAPVSALNLFGYSISFIGVGWYNWQKIQAMRRASEKAHATLKDEETTEQSRLAPAQAGTK